MSGPFVVTEISGSELSEWRRNLSPGARRARSKPGASQVGPSAVVDGEGAAVFESPRLPPSSPAEVYSRQMATLTKWAKSDRDAWQTSIDLFRQTNPSAASHMTDFQLGEMLHGKVDRAIKEAFANLGRGSELVVRA